MSRLPSPAPKSARLLGLSFALLLVAFGTWVRVDTAVSDPNFDLGRPEGLFKSDPGLLYYLVQRVEEAGGGVPDDWRADANIEHPRRIDVPATFTVGQEFLIAWAHRALAPRAALHVFCLWSMAVCASLAVLFVYGIALELGGSVRWACLAALAYALTPAAYRTIGFLLVREDVCLPLFALHLWLFARAVRLRTSAPALGAGVALGAALATWHAAGLLATLEALALFAYFLARDRSPFDDRRGLAALVLVAASCTVVPALRAKVALLSLPMQLAAALAVAGRLPRARRAPRARRVAAALATWAGLALLARLFSGGDLSHVAGLFAAKLRFGGVLPADPELLPFDVRLLWQGPFATLPPGAALKLLGALALFLVPILADAWRAEPAPVVACTFVLASLVAAWLAERLVVLPALSLGAAGAASCARIARRFRPGAVYVAGFGGLLLAAQGAVFLGWRAGHSMSWYRPALRQDEIAGMVRALPEHVPPGAAVLSDFVNSTAVLAHARRPICVQPKWESRESRRRVELFWTAFYRDGPRELRRVMLEELDCHYLLVDRFTLGIQRASRYVAGLGECASEAMLAGEPVPGFELLWRSSPELVQSNGQPSDFFRLYRALE